METLVKEQTTKKGQLVDIGKGIKAGIINITPEQAEKMLEHNHSNRGIKKGKISQYAMDMEEGMWHMNGLPIIFNPDGELLDGQNRLNAVIRAGVSTEFLVVTGVSRDAFKTIDTGALRNGSDVLTIIGVPPEQASRTSALIKKIYKDQTGQIGSAWNRSTPTFSSSLSFNKRPHPTNQMIVEYYKSNKQELDEIWEFGAKHQQKAKRLMPFALFLFVFYKLRKVNLIDAEEFCAKLATGDMLSNEDPIYHLREKFIALKNSDTEKVPSWYYAGYTYKAWNAFRRKTPMRRLVIKNDETEPVKPI